MESELRKLANQVAAMRQLQRDYFRTRDSAVLAQSKEAERAVDKRCKEILEPSSLFGGEVG